MSAADPREDEREPPENADGEPMPPEPEKPVPW